jgi:hypothetical protein
MNNYFFIIKNKWNIFLLLAVIIAISSFVYSAIASPPSSKYTAGETLAPSCSVGDINCTTETPITSNEIITLSGDVSGSGTSSLSVTIIDNAIEESMLKAVDSAVDEECLTYESTTGDFEWQSCGSSYGASGTLLNESSNVFSVNEGTMTDTKLCTYISGTGLVCNSDPGGLSVFTETQNSTSPNNIVYVDSLSATGSATNIDIALVPKGTGSLLAQVPDNTATGGSKRGNYSVDLQTSRFFSQHVAYDHYSVVGGGQSNQAASDYTVSLGGFDNNAGDGTFSEYSVVIGGRVNSATSDYTFIGGGRNNSTSLLSNYSAVGGGYDNDVSGHYSVILGGSNNDIVNKSNYSAIGGGLNNKINSSTSNYSFIGGGLGNETNALYSGILGGIYGKTTMFGQEAQASGRFSVTGDAQRSMLVANISTEDAVETELFLDNTDDRMILPTDTTWYYTIAISARRTDADNESAGYEFRGVIDNNAGTTALVGSQQIETDIEDIPAWSCAVTADDTNDALVIKCTGEASKTIYWVAFIELTQVTG